MKRVMFLIFITINTILLSQFFQAFFAGGIISLTIISWIRSANQPAMRYTPDHCMGYRITLSHYATIPTGGYVDFDYFHSAFPVN
jgi:hypothetical protein